VPGVEQRLWPDGTTKSSTRLGGSAGGTGFFETTAERGSSSEERRTDRATTNQPVTESGQRWGRSTDRPQRPDGSGRKCTVRSGRRGIDGVHVWLQRTGADGHRKRSRRCGDPTGIPRWSGQGRDKPSPKRLLRKTEKKKMCPQREREPKRFDSKVDRIMEKVKLLSNLRLGFDVGAESDQGMPSARSARKSSWNKVTANDERFALAA
jgi:hypothetical protein